MKTPEELAKEFSKYEPNKPGNGALDHYRAGLYEGFLAGHKAAQQWISVKDRLPEIAPMVLAMCTNGYELAYYGMYGQNWTNTLGTEYLNVTHWHTLPEPPKDEK